MPALDDNLRCRGGRGWLEVCLGLSVIALLGQLTGPSVLRIWREWPQAGQQTPGHFQVPLAAGGQVEIQFLIYLPKDYSVKIHWPILLYLHGASQRGDDLHQLTKHGLPAILASGRQLPLIVVSPQCQANQNWDCDQLLAFLDYLEKKFAINPNRVYVAGESMGGYGTWALATTAPERFAAAVPACGGGNVEQAGRLVKLPIWAFHGAKDTTVPLEESQRMVDTIQKLGGNAQLTILPDKGHDIREAVFSRNDIYDWMLQQQRSVRTVHSD